MASQQDADRINAIFANDPQIQQIVKSAQSAPKGAADAFTMQHKKALQNRLKQMGLNPADYNIDPRTGRVDDKSFLGKHGRTIAGAAIGGLAAAPFLIGGGAVPGAAALPGVSGAGSSLPGMSGALTGLGAGGGAAAGGTAAAGAAAGGIPWGKFLSSAGNIASGIGSVAGSANEAVANQQESNNDYAIKRGTQDIDIWRRQQDAERDYGQLDLDRNRQGIDIWGKQQDAEMQRGTLDVNRGQLDLDRNKFDLDSQGTNAKRALVAALLGNMQDVKLDMPGYVPQFNFSGGARPSALGENGRAAAADMGARATAQLQAGNTHRFGTDVGGNILDAPKPTYTGGGALAAPTLAPLERVKGNSMLDALGLGGSFLGVLGNLAKKPAVR